MKLRYVKKFFMHSGDPAKFTVGQVYDAETREGWIQLTNDVGSPHGFYTDPENDTDHFDLFDHFEVVKEDGCNTEEHY